MSALHRFLLDFDAVAPCAPPVAAGLPFDDMDLPAEPEAEPAEPPVDRVAEAVSAALEEADLAHAAALDDLAARHAGELAEARARWAADEGIALAEGFRAAVAGLADALGEEAAMALEPLLGGAARDLAVEGLRSAVADLVLAGTGGAVAVSGPADLLDALRAALGASGVDTAGMAFTPSEAADVSVAADNSRIETRLGAWADALRARLPGAASGPSEDAA